MKAGPLRRLFPQHAAPGLRTLFGSGLVTGGTTALLLNLIFPEEM